MNVVMASATNEVLSWLHGKDGRWHDFGENGVLTWLHGLGTNEVLTWFHGKDEYCHGFNMDEV